MQCQLRIKKPLQKKKKKNMDNYYSHILPSFHSSISFSGNSVSFSTNSKEIITENVVWNYFGESHVQELSLDKLGQDT